jgi:hypothetical protein
VSDIIAPEDRPDLQDYMSKEQPSKRAENSNSCKYCNKTFSSMEELTLHYRKEHPESF